ncbi:hypothetical protein AM232_25780 [Bacillus sp. FJAT-21352]|nr:hypothetical protein AM232_25780 [Bacillus sp. FJAT-21352]
MERKVQDSCEKASPRETYRALTAPRRLTDRPFKSGCLRWNETVNVQIPQNCGQFKRSFHAELTGMVGARLLREYECRGDTAGANAEEAPRTACGKRVPAVE